MSKTKKTYERQSERTGWETLPPSTDIFTDSPVEVHGAINFKRAGPVIKRLPKGSRVQCAKAVTTLLEDVLTKNDNKSWERLLSFPSRCLSAPKRAGSKKKCSLATHINRRIDLFESTPHQPDLPKPRTSQQSIKNQVATKLSSGDVKGAIRLLASSDKIQSPSPEVLRRLKEKHPEPLSRVEIPSPGEPNEFQPCSLEEVKKAIGSFKPGLSGGPDGLQPQHLKDLTKEDLGEPSMILLDKITRLLNEILYRGRVPEEVCKVLYGANLTALSKPDGGTRPIAVGMVWRRLAGKILLGRLYSQSQEMFNPNQLGVGTPKGAEAAVHAIRTYTSSPKVRNKVVLKIDLRNAFNCISRHTMLEKVRIHAPEAYPFVFQCYAMSSYLFFGDQDIILSMEGVQQGDPLGPFLFSLTINDLVKACKSPMNIFYLDDGTLGGTDSQVLEDFMLISENMKLLGPEINSEKCELYLVNHSSVEGREAVRKFEVKCPGIKILDKTNLTLLGTPVFPEAIESTLRKKMSELKLMVDRLSQLDAHDALFLLRNALSIPKLTYFLRTAPSFLEIEVLRLYDKLLKEALQLILNINLKESAWNQSTLPISKGGLGVKLASELAGPAYLSSVCASKNLTNSLLPECLRSEKVLFYEQASEDWKSTLSTDSLPANPSFQSEWEGPLLNKRFLMLFNEAQSNEEKARILAVSSEHSSDYLHALPIASLGLKLDNQSLRISCALRLGSLICHQHKCICGNKVNSFGRHGLSCKFQAGRHPRHSQLNDIVQRALNLAGYPSRLEPTGLSRKDGKRPDGLSLYPYKLGKCIIWDSTVVDTLAVSYVDQTASLPGKAAEKAETKKMDLYQELEKEYLFIPIAIETLGSWGQAGLKFIKELGRQIQEKSGEKRATQYLFQRCSMAVQRGNSASILGTVNSSGQLDEIFYL